MLPQGSFVVSSESGTILVQKGQREMLTDFVFRYNQPIIPLTFVAAVDTPSSISDTNFPWAISITLVSFTTILLGDEWLIVAIDPLEGHVDRYVTVSVVASQ